MRFWLLLAVLGGLVGPVAADSTNWEVQTLWGSLRTPYLYPISELEVRSPGVLVAGWPLRADLRWRSYGNLWFFSPQSDDLQARLELPLALEGPLEAAGQLGWELGLRLQNDLRSAATSYGCPVVGWEMRGHWDWFRAAVNLEVQVFQDGLGLRVSPTLRCQLLPALAVTAKLDGQDLVSWTRGLNEWHWETLAGLTLSL